MFRERKPSGDPQLLGGCGCPNALSARGKVNREHSFVRYYRVEKVLEPGGAVGSTASGEPDGSVPVVRSTPDFSAFYRSEYRAVATLTMVLTHSRSAAEDIAQDAFLRAHRDWDRVGRFDNPGGWVRRVAINLALSRFRRMRAETKALLRARPVRSTTTMSIEATEFWSEVRHLPTRQAQVVALHYVEDRSVEDIAAILGITTGSVKTHLHRARDTLAERFGSREEAP
jgi:RNA polymerase sigma-70 factor, ECF subfamily